MNFVIFYFFLTFLFSFSGIQKDNLQSKVSCSLLSEKHVGGKN